MHWAQDSDMDGPIKNLEFSYASLVIKVHDVNFKILGIIVPHVTRCSRWVKSSLPTPIVDKCERIM